MNKKTICADCAYCERHTSSHPGICLWECTSPPRRKKVNFVTGVQDYELCSMKNRHGNCPDFFAETENITAGPPVPAVAAEDAR